jgi:P27 family predicted phage terminase small subunit
MHDNDNHPRQPDGLTVAERQHWQHLVRDAEPTLTAADSDALEMYVRTWARWRKAERRVAELGDIIDGQMNPWLTIVFSSATILAALGQQLGFTPASRAAINGDAGRFPGDEWKDA